MKYTELSALGEFGLIDHLTRDIKLKNTSSLKGVGDDAAILDYSGKQLLVSTDMLIQGATQGYTDCEMARRDHPNASTGAMQLLDELQTLEQDIAREMKNYL